MKTYLRAIFGGLIFIVFASMGLGVYVLATSPYTGLKLVFGDNTGYLELRGSSAHDYIFPVDKLVKIGGIVLEKDDFLRFPEFFFPKVEARWWEKQQKLYTLTRQNNTIELEFHQENNQPLVTSVALGSIPTLEIIKRLGPINLVALIFVVLATHVFYKHFSLPHQICGFFTGFLALYLVSAAPIAYRDITLPTDLFRLLIKGVLFGAGGLITLVHFALIFPKPKPFLLVRPKLIYGLYGYYLITATLYLLKISAFGSTFPFLVLWTLVMVSFR